jgi:hypothetical protein
MEKQMKAAKKLILFFGSIYLSIPVFAQLQEPEWSDMEKLEQKIEMLESSITVLRKLKVSGYIQTQFQQAQAAADGINFKLTNRANPYESNAYYPGSDEYKGLEGFSRFGIRRGRFKLTFEEGIATGVAQIDVTEKGINSTAVPGRAAVMFKDIYLGIKDPWFGTNHLKAGIFDRPFGFEIAYSSSLRESPERSRIFQMLFPDERDLGVSLTLQPSKTSPLNFLKLEGGWFAGNGIRPQIGSRMDFIGRLSASHFFGNNMSLSGGISLYAGGVLQTDSSTYVMKDKKFELESKTRANIGRLAKRQYTGFDVQYSLISSAGLTTVRGEYVFGEHPGNVSGAYSFGLDGIPGGPVYMRKISGGYVMLVQDLGQTPFSAIFKYDWYNPNTAVSGNDIAVEGSGTTRGDIALSNVGVGLYWRINQALRLTAYYDFVSNETTTHLKNTKDDKGNLIAYGYESNRPDNVFTLRLQYRF